MLTDSRKTAGFWRRQPTALKLALGIFVLVDLLFVLWIPSFEGPDESEHYRYVIALADRAPVHPIDPGDPTRYGYEIYQPPLYYLIAAGWAKLARVEPMTALTVNPSQNPRYPFIRHDLPDHTLPWAGMHRGLRKMRLLSLLAGVATALLVLQLGELLMPASIPGRLALFALVFTPNMLQVFATVSNDGLCIALAMGGIVAAIHAGKRPECVAIHLASGVLLGLAVLTKFTGLAVVATVGCFLLIDVIRTGLSRQRLAGAAAWFLPVLLLAGGYMAYSSQLYGDPTRELLLTTLCPGMRKPEAAGVVFILGELARDMSNGILVQLCWNSVHFLWGSRLLTALWLVTTVVWCGRCVLCIKRHKPLRTVDWVPLLAFAWALAFQVAANRHFASMQVRHMLPLWPLMAAAPAMLAAHASRPRQAAAQVIVALAILLPATAVAWSMLTFNRFYGAAVEATADRDYDTYLYAYHRNRQRGDSYLATGDFVAYDVAAQFQKGNWAAVRQTVEGAATSQLSPEIGHMYAVALLESGEYDRAAAVSERLAAVRPATAIVHLRALFAMGLKDDASRHLTVYLSRSEGRLNDALLALRKELGLPAGSLQNFDGEHK
ncbi:MAG: glycosyltransferase family 39 protein [Lentisphaeria bacterium]|jgi:4-amino-4-deoxy-L-arabinose transferase-like glycosyltransferase|nr:glycosyltransferase family 39 protein [Lentisphaeria bacterium]MDP7743116.1 glycosyltransferase family 39 protein [Lentisphaeria bacterium]